MSEDDANGPVTTAAPALILIAHGSRRAPANDAHLDLCGRVGAQLGRHVSPAFLELADPTIPGAIDDAVERHGACHLVLLPYFLHPGNHTLRDIPALVDDARRRHPGVTIEQLDHIGSSDAMVGLVADRFAVT